MNDEGFKFACQEHYWEIIQYLLSFSGERYIKFQETEYNLDWAMENKCYDVVYTMVKSLYKNDMITYIANISKIEQYCEEHDLNFEEWQKEIEEKRQPINMDEMSILI